MRACQSMCVREREKYVCVKKRFMFMDEMRELYVCVCVLRVCVCVCAAHSETPQPVHKMLCKDASTCPN